MAEDLKVSLEEELAEKETTTAANQKEETSTTLTSVDGDGNETILDNIEVKTVSYDPNRLAGLMQKAEKLAGAQRLFNIVPKYREFTKQGDSMRGLWLGFKEMNIKDKETGELTPIPAAMWVGIEDGNMKTFINAGVALVNEFKRACLDEGMEIEISYQGKNGDTKVYDITLLKIDE